MTDIEAMVAGALREQCATVATAESCTAGLVAARFADRPGSSDYLVGGFVTYSNSAKTSQLGIPEDLIARVGAVSEDVAVAMARGARQRLGTTYGISTTGVAGPGGASPDKPVGLVHVAVASADRTWHERLHINGNRAQVRASTVTGVLGLLLLVLEEQGAPSPPLPRAADAPRTSG